MFNKQEIFDAHTKIHNQHRINIHLWHNKRTPKSTNRGRIFDTTSGRPNQPIGAHCFTSSNAPPIVWLGRPIVLSKVYVDYVLRSLNIYVCRFWIKDFLFVKHLDKLVWLLNVWLNCKDRWLYIFGLLITINIDLLYLFLPFSPPISTFISCLNTCCAIKATFSQRYTAIHYCTYNVVMLSGIPDSN